MKPISILAFFIFSCSPAVFGQGKREMDSLLRQFAKQEQPDTAYARTASRISAGYTLSGKYADALNYGRKSFAFARHSGNTDCIADACSVLAFAYNYKGSADSALEVLRDAFVLDQSQIAPSTLSSLYGNRGLAYYTLGDYAKALDNHFHSLAINEKIKNKKGQANTLNNIAITYQRMEDYDKALVYLRQSIALKKNFASPGAIATSLGNLGILYYRMKAGDSAMICYRQALVLSKKAGTIATYARTLTNMGIFYADEKKFDSALICQQRSLAIRDSIGDEDGVARSEEQLCELYWQMGDYKNAVAWGNKSVDQCRKTGDSNSEAEVHKYLSMAYQKLGATGLALVNLVAHDSILDSITSETQQREAARMELKYIFDKKAETDSLNHVIDHNHQEELIQQEEQGRKYLIGGIVLVCFFSVFLYSRFRITRKQKAIIEEQKKTVESQKNIVDQKNKEVFDSIAYAQRLQQAILPSEKTWKENLPESFVLYLPKDIVAGDFYWMENVVVNDNPIILFCAADCTGHGVPGAMVSVVCSNALKRSVNEFRLTKPGEILGKVRELVIETFEQSGQQVRDGMDISLCALDKKNKTLHWAGANLPLWHVREKQFYEFKGDKQPVGYFENTFPFTTHSISLEKGDWLYVITDGYGDQFGGDKGKKFKLRQLRELVKSLPGLDAKSQNEKLLYTFLNWKNNLEQVDDVTIIGVKV